ncbi:3,4-dihydroxy-2-butanone-4-phosphate synthase [Rhodococcus aetherivorans]
MDQLTSGNPIIVATDGNTALVYGAAAVTTAQMADLIKRSSGFVQVALPPRQCDALLIPEAAPINSSPCHPSYGQCVTVDAANGITTGISAEDRAHTARILCAPTTAETDLTRPGHVVPVRAEAPLGPYDSHLPLATLVLALTMEALPVPGAAYAELTSELDPRNPVQIGEARQIAKRTHTILVHD